MVAFFCGLFLVPSGGAYNILLIFFFFLFSGFAFISLRLTALLVVFFIPLAGALRWNDSGSPLAALFQSGIFSLAIIAAFFHVLIRTRFRVARLPISHLLLFVPFFLLIFLHTLIIFFSNPILGFALVREYILPLLLFFVFYYAIRMETIEVRFLVLLLVVVTSGIAVVDIVHYFFDLGAPYPRYVWARGVDYIPETRSVFGHSVARSQHLLGLGSQGGGAVFYAIIGMLGILLLRETQGFTRFLLLTASFLLFVAGALIISGSFMMALVLMGGYLLVTQGAARNPIVQKTLLGIILSFFLFLIVSSDIFVLGNRQISLISYGVTWWDRGTAILFNLAGFPLFVGGGLGVLGRVGLDLDMTGRVFFDTWIFSVVPQLGLVGFFSMLLSWAYWLWLTSSKTAFVRRICTELKLAGLILVGALAYVHQAAFVSRLMIPVLMLGVAIVLAVGARRRQ